MNKTTDLNKLGGKYNLRKRKLSLLLVVVLLQVLVVELLIIIIIIIIIRRRRRRRRRRIYLNTCIWIPVVTGVIHDLRSSYAVSTGSC